MHKILAITACLALGASACAGIVTVDRDSEPYGMGYLSGRLMHDADPSHTPDDKEIVSRCGTFRDAAHQKSSMPDDAEHNLNFMDGCKSGMKGESPPEGLRKYFDR
ncbi:hypothetical protein OG394_16930 [Kribbella sp. NBC_01245]|uniref:hypothetical protein n=1 Tax=Kribbella sp. NBC_01245 TaxID=2903578 RepID=UPI002E29CC17|nr:hypothetical protein [Kribbella sp. NBC_01245]